MQKWLDDSDVLLYSTHHKGKWIAAERSVRTRNGKMYKKMTGNDSTSYLGYLNKLVDEYNNYHHSIIVRVSAARFEETTVLILIKFQTNGDIVCLTLLQCQCVFYLSY